MHLQSAPPQPITAHVRLRGCNALSDFRVEKLQRSLHAQGVVVEGLAAEFAHFVALSRPLDEKQQAALQGLLSYGTSAPGEQPPIAFFVVPRIGTVSPWASKATDIANNCGLDAVVRIERGVAVSVGNWDALNADARAAVAAVFHDRMTECVVPAGFSGEELFAQHKPQPLTTVPVLERGISALQRANAELGLAMSPDEIEYLGAYFSRIRRNPTDVELMMFAQANSEHCRHKIFNARWTIDGADQTHSLFGMIRNTHQQSPKGTVVAYSDNSSVIEGARIQRFYPDAAHRYDFHEQETHILMKVETHNHPTAIAPWPGAATGSGGEIRDEGATGRGAKPKAGLTGFSVSNLRIPGYERPWETPYGKPSRMASALDIMIEGPIGGAAFNNEFGRINLCGYFRTFEQPFNGQVRGYHKPIMIAGGLGNISAAHTQKRDLSPGDLLVQLGGPGMRIGLGGGAASSMSSGSNVESLDFDSVQRANAEMQRRCQEVIDACWQLGEHNPILSIHDVGAGGISNALPELAHGGGVGALVDLRALPSLEPGMSPREIWSNESQERYMLAISESSLPVFEKICARERCPFAVLGRATVEHKLVVEDAVFANKPVDMDMDALLGKPPRMHRTAVSAAPAHSPFALDDIELKDALYRVLSLPAVADKSFLITIGDRSVGGLTARDQFVGPWQVPVADCAVTLMGYRTLRGEAMAMGERTPIAVLDAPASGRMAIGEALTNIVAADVRSIGDIKLSANWMAAAGHGNEDAALFATVEAVGMQLCPALGISIPVGKDSLSMKTVWEDGGVEKSVVAPVSLIVSAFAPVQNAARTLTPLLVDQIQTELLLIDLGRGKNRMGASALAQVYCAEGGVAPDLDNAADLVNFFAAVRELASDGLILAYHDRSDGGLAACVAEMMFASRRGVTLYLDTLIYAERESDVDEYEVGAESLKLGANAAAVAALFTEELGAVLQIETSNRTRVMEVLRGKGLGAAVSRVGHPNDSDELRLIRGAKPMLVESRTNLQRAWSETSFRIQALRDNPNTARQEFDAVLEKDGALTALPAKLTFDALEDIAAPYISRAPKPSVAILREQGVNGQVEMAHAFARAGFQAIDVHMSDILAGRVRLEDFIGLAACGGFSYGDVLGAGEGWAKSILFNARARDQFSAFFARTDSFALGVCNGCQMMSNLSSIIPGAENWPHFERNLSEQYEARTVAIHLRKSPSILFSGMDGAVLPVPTAHGEGRAVFRDDAQRDAARWLCAAEFVDGTGKPTENFPANPNGSPLGMTAFTTPDGRFTIMMPHPERATLNVNLSWRPSSWPAEDGSGTPAQSPWARMFANARQWVG